MTRKLAQAIIILFFFSIPCENILTISTFGSLSRIVGLGTASLWLVSIVVEKQLRRFTSFHIMAFIFFVFGVMSVFWTVDYDLTFIRIKTYLQLIIQIWMIWDLITTVKIFRISLLSYLLGTFIVIIDLIKNFISGQIISEWDIGRYSGGGQNAVELSLILSLCLPLAWYIAITEKSTRFGKIIKGICFLFVPASFISIILTASRTGILSIIPGIFFILITLKKISPGFRILIFIFSLITLIVGQLIIPHQTLERLSTFGASLTTGDLGGRTSLWKRGFQIFIENPLLGIGSNGTSSTKQLGAVVHNTFISILAEIGIIGFILFFVLIISIIFQIRKMPLFSANLWLTILMIWIIGIQTLTWEYTKTTWFFLSMIVIAGNLIDITEKPH